MLRLGHSHAGGWGSRQTLESAVLSSFPVPEPDPWGSAGFCSVLAHACGKRLGTQGLMRKLKLGYDSVGGCSLGVKEGKKHPWL